MADPSGPVVFTSSASAISAPGMLAPVYRSATWMVISGLPAKRGKRTVINASAAGTANIAMLSGQEMPRHGRTVGAAEGVRELGTDARGSRDVVVRPKRIVGGLDCIQMPRRGCRDSATGPPDSTESHHRTSLQVRRRPETIAARV